MGTSPPLTSHVRRAAGAAKGPRAPRGYLCIMVRPASASARRFPGRTSEPLCTRVAADACECRLCPVLTCVFAHSQHGAWRARSCARVSGTAGEQDLHSRLPATMPPSRGAPCSCLLHSSTPLDHPLPETCACAFLPRVRACLVNKRVLLLPRVRACFFSCTGLGLSSSSYRPSAPRWVGSFTRCGAPSRAEKNCSSFLHDDCRGTRPNPSPVLPLPGVVSEPPCPSAGSRCEYRQDPEVF